MQLVFESPVGVYEADLLPVLRLVNSPEILKAELFPLVFAFPDRSRCAIAEEAQADEHARFIVQVKGGGGDFHGHRRDRGLRFCRKNAARCLEKRQGGPTAQAKQILQKGIGLKPENFRNVAAQARTKVSGTGADKESVDTGGLKRGRFAGLENGI